MLDVQHLKEIGVKIGRQYRLLCLGKALNGIAFTFEWLDW